MKILACAVGFGLGPNGKLCSIINYNKKQNNYKVKEADLQTRICQKSA